MNFKILTVLFVSALSPLFGSFSYAIQVSETQKKAVTTAVDDDADAMPVVFSTQFDKSDDVWKFLDDSWKFETKDDVGVLSLHKKKTNYKPKFRSPGHIALLNNKSVGDFELNVRAKSTHVDYNHQDVCLFFGYQSPTQFYYVHLGKKTDIHANQIFIVNNAARTKISLTTTAGTPWDEEWHDLRVTRNAATGEIKIYFDDMKTPIMTAKDTTFATGKIGVGSFDDTADFDSVELKGIVAPETDAAATDKK